MVPLAADVGVSGLLVFTATSLGASPAFDCLESASLDSLAKLACVVWLFFRVSGALCTMGPGWPWESSERGAKKLPASFKGSSSTRTISSSPNTLKSSSSDIRLAIDGRDLSGG